MFKDINKLVQDRLDTRTVTAPTTSYMGKVMSAPGTEKIVLSTSEVDFMTCIAVGTSNKERCCIVHKNKPIRFDGQFVDSRMFPVTITTKAVFAEVTALLNNAGKQIQTLKRDLEKVTIERDAYKMTIDSLRKNGVID